MIPFGQWLPDFPVLENPGATEAKNVFARSVGGYGPVSDKVVFSDALTARCQGAFPSRDRDGNVSNFAGDATKLYKLSGITYSDVSKVGGYSTPADSFWSFIQFGQRVVATNFVDAIQSWVLGTSSVFADLSASAPKARYLAEIRDFLMVGNTFDSTDGNVPNRVWWSGTQDPTSWETPGTAAAAAVQSDYQDLPGGWVQGIVGAVGGADGLVISETAIHRISFEGPPTAFRFDKIEDARGCPAPGSIVKVGSYVYYLSEDGFYRNNGAFSEPIGNQKVDKYFFSDLDQSYFYRITSASDPINKLIWWSYASSSGAGTPDKVLIFNYETGWWARAEISIEYLFRNLTPGYTLDGLDVISANIDTGFAVSFDSRVYTAGRLALACFDTDHKQALFTGSNLAAVVETGEIGGPTFNYVDGIRPYVNGGTVTAAVRYRNTPSGSLTDTTATSAGDDGVCPQNISARYMRGQVNIAAGGSWTQAQGIDVVMVADGGR
jgi:hypothetical protein